VTGPVAGMPVADVDVTIELVRALLQDQHPDLGSLELRVASAGWDNVMMRLGDQLAVRLPRRRESVAGLQNEQRWLPFLGERLPAPVPVPMRTGVPGRGYPYVWSVVQWLPGEPAYARPLSAAGLTDLAVFLRTLHVEAPGDAPLNPFRGVPLAERDAAFADRRDRALARGVDVSVADLRWAAGLAAPSAQETVWVHGDMHHANVLVSGDGRLSAVIDWNDVCGGDAAGDLSAAWLIADDPEAFLSAYGPLSAGLRERAAGWAAYLALMFLEADAPGETLHADMGRAALRRLAP
jgi:aminoglycoside phosphotransferase (APT) family kinase protein